MTTSMSTTISSLDDLQALADRVVALVHDLGAAQDGEVEANVRVSRTRHGLTRFANSFIHQHVGEDSVEVALTLALDGRTTSASTTRIGEEELAELVRTALASAALQPVDPGWPGATPPGEASFVGNHDQATAAASPDERAEGVEAFVAAEPGFEAAGYLDTEATWTAFASTAGQRIAGSATRATIDGIHRSATSAGSAHQTSTRLGELDAAAAGARAARLARDGQDPIDLAPGTYPVVLGPEAAATLLTFLAVYGFNAKSYLDGGSFVRLGEQQLDPSLTLWQDPTDPRVVALPFDAEGTPHTRYPLIEEGVPRQLAHDRRTAKRFGDDAVSTGDALPFGAGFGAVPTSMVLTPGERSPEELVAGIERGLLVTSFNYVRVLEPKAVSATGLTRNGTFLIEDGEVTRPVSNLRFTQGFVAALAPGQVLGIGNDDRYADGEFGAGVVITPSLALGAWAFTGGAQG
ncbi:MAG: TldD/PmbA family protein [Nitriliruptoraceae bacterium]